MWDAFQREALEAMGHVVHAPRVPSPAAPATSTAATAGPGAPVPRGLLQALARAAGVRPEALPPLPPLAQLRTPAGKRALWPTLRALRRDAR
ncbi:MAG: hypothetical protein ACTHKZ_06475 [Lysobacteraceae bacterium]